MKKDIEQKQGVDITHMVNHLIASAKGEHDDGKTKLTVDEKTQTEFLDSLVVTLGIDHKICSNYSSLISNSDKHVSDDYAKTIVGRLLLKAAGAKALGCKRSEIDVSDENLQSFCDEHDLYQYPFDGLMSTRAQETHFGGQKHILPIIRWRWNNELMFGDYRDRVLQYMNHVADAEVNLEVNRVVGNALDYYKAKQIVENDFDVFCESEVFAKWNPLTKEVFSAVRKSRLVLDRISLRALSSGHKPEVSEESEN